MKELRKFLAPEFVFGRGAIDLVCQYVENFGAVNPLLVTDSGLLAAGWPDKVLSSLRKKGISSTVYSDISPNPRDSEVMKGVGVFISSECDSVIAVGGGSVIDCAKGIAVCSVERENILAFTGVDKIPYPGPPIICVPTTAGSSADVSQFAIINDEKRKTKIAIISKAVVPDVALIDPQTTHTMDSYLTACTGMDALVHAVEAFVSTAHSPLFDIHAVEAVKIIFTSLREVLQSPDNKSLRNDIMRASLEAGLAFSNTSLGAVHAMAHSMGGYIDLSHGECNSILLDHVISYNSSVAGERYSLLSEAAGCDPAHASSEKFIELVGELKKDIGITASLKDYGVTEKDIPRLSEYALNDVCMITNPREPGLDDIQNIYRKAL